MGPREAARGARLGRKGDEGLRANVTALDGRDVDLSVALGIRPAESRRLALHQAGGRVDHGGLHSRADGGGDGREGESRLGSEHCECACQRVWKWDEDACEEYAINAIQKAMVMSGR